MLDSQPDESQPDDSQPDPSQPAPRQCEVIVFSLLTLTHYSKLSPFNQLKLWYLRYNNCIYFLCLSLSLIPSQYYNRDIFKSLHLNQSLLTTCICCYSSATLHTLPTKYIEFNAIVDVLLHSYTNVDLFLS